MHDHEVLSPFSGELPKCVRCSGVARAECLEGCGYFCWECFFDHKGEDSNLSIMDGLLLAVVEVQIAKLDHLPRSLIYRRAFKVSLNAELVEASLQEMIDEFNRKEEETMKVIAKFESDSVPGKFYELREDKFGKVYCTCWGWLRSKANPKQCKHLARIKNIFRSGEDRQQFKRAFERNGDGKAHQKEAEKAPWER